MAFSGGVKLGDLDDFLNPSSECVKPLIEASTAPGGAFKIEKTDARGPIMAPQSVSPAVQVQRPNLIKTKKSVADPKAEIGQVSLSDCLACSGCVTSAETVLLQEQSGEEFLKKVATSPVTVVSISGEARTSLATYFNASPLETMLRVAGALRKLGVTYVLEGSAAEAIALLEGEAEFIQRYKASRDRSEQRRNGSAPVPLLTSHCPGWVLYAEKVVDPSVIPHLTPQRPPQQIQGRLVKTCLLEAHNRRRFYRWWHVRSPLFAAETWRWLLRLEDRKVSDVLGASKPVTPDEVYHVSVQPCFDRKIEAARPHFEAPGGNGVREVDTVLTASELLDLLRQNVPEPDCDGVWDANPPRAASALWDCLPPCSTASETFTDLCLGDLSDQNRGRQAPLLCAVRGANAGAGGFTEHVFRNAAAKLFEMTVDSPLTFKTTRNQDMREVTLEDPKSHEVLLRFVTAYGFRNITNVMRRLTKPQGNPRKECGDFVEIMACPGGCLNGAGQVIEKKKDGNAPSDSERREKLGELEHLLHSGDGVAVVAPREHPLTLPIYRYIHSHATNAAPGAQCGEELRLDDLVGGSAVQDFLAAAWKSLKVDSEGNAVVGSSALKW